MINNSIEWYLNELDALIKIANRKKIERFGVGFLSIVGLVVFYFRKTPFKIDFINAISAYMIIQYIISSLSLSRIKAKMKLISDEFVNSGKFDECDIEKRQEYNNIISEINELKI